MRHRVSARITTALALVAASTALSVSLSPAPASADVDGFSVAMGQSPATFTIGKQARSVTAVASTEREQRCFRVRWELVIRTDGVSLDQVRVNRIENGQAFRVRVQLGDDEARIVDAAADPGQLCRDQTVTGRWDISFTGPDDGEVTFSARALDGGGRRLSAAEASSRVVTPVAAKPSASPSASPSDSSSDSSAAGDEAAVSDDTPTADPATSSAALNPAAGTPSVLGPGIIIGAVLVFLGVALLLRIRTRNRKDPAWQTETQALPTGFYSMPKRRRR